MHALSRAALAAVTRPRAASHRAALAATAFFIAAFVACEREDEPRSAALVVADSDTVLADLPGTPGEDADRAIFEDRVRWALENRLDTLPIGQIVARVGRTFVGTRYVPGVLDVPGEERLIVNLRELDCVTYVENMLAMARLIRQRNTDFDDFRRELTRIRYRDGIVAGYPSRLHYFSEWISDGERKGILRDITRELGGIPDPEPINFMSTHASSYAALAAPENLAAIRDIEQRLSARPRYFIPEDRIAEAAPRIQDGDIIAATAAVPGLDIVHTGIALHVGDQLHLMHAPLVGKNVEISELPLARRIQSIDGQDGIMVARPLEP